MGVYPPIGLPGMVHSKLVVFDKALDPITLLPAPAKLVFLFSQSTEYLEFSLKVPPIPLASPSNGFHLDDKSMELSSREPDLSLKVLPFSTTFFIHLRS